ncbi:MAG: hypothetical protein O2816_00870, partial [Planctomycetota bacterium]|nr:hypothetical protein [Planctomycetota bacterium]
APSLPSSADQVLPDGVKAIVPGRGGVAVVHEAPPQPMSLRWLAADSETRFGPGTQYRTVRLALPYVWILALYQHEGDRLVLTNANECFFSNEPLRTLDQEPRFPALLNCSRFSEGLPKPLAWICTASLDLPALHKGPAQQSLSAGLAALRDHLFQAAFNESSEHHEQSSWFKETVDAAVDPRVASVEAWEAASLEDPLFALEVPWLPTQQSLRVIAERALTYALGRGRKVETARDVLRLVMAR